jgi:hypothetical protein
MTCKLVERKGLFAAKKRPRSLRSQNTRLEILLNGVEGYAWLFSPPLFFDKGCLSMPRATSLGLSDLNFPRPAFGVCWCSLRVDVGSGSATFRARPGVFRVEGKRKSMNLLDVRSRRRATYKRKSWEAHALRICSAVSAASGAKGLRQHKRCHCPRERDI